MKFSSAPYLLIAGLLLMTLPFIPLNASDDQARKQVLLTDFTANSSDLSWFVVNDNVMGGRSEGDFVQRSGELTFTGRTDTNGGGFASIRTKPLQLDLSDHSGIQLRVKGDGRRYTWRLTTTERWRGYPVSYWAEFKTRKDTWSTINIPFESFVPRFRGTLLDGLALDPKQITGMGLMIYDNQDGAFELRMAALSAYTSHEVFTLKQYQWKNRVLVVSAPAEDDKRLVDQQNELALAPEEFANRDMTLVTLLDNAGSTAGTRELTSEETANTRHDLGISLDSFALRLIGKDGSVKLSAEETTSMKEIYALIDTMPMRQREKTVHQ